MKMIVSAIAAAMLLVSPVALSDSASAHGGHWKRIKVKGHHHHRIWVKHHHHHRHFVRHGHGARFVVKVGFGSPYRCW